MEDDYHGFYREWYPSGNLFCEGILDRGFKVGAWIYWNQDGSRISVKNYTSDSLVFAIFYEYFQNGNIKSSKEYFDNTFTVIKSYDKELNSEFYELREKSQKEMKAKGKWCFYSNMGSIERVEQY